MIPATTSISSTSTSSKCLHAATRGCGSSTRSLIQGATGATVGKTLLGLRCVKANGEICGLGADVHPLDAAARRLPLCFLSGSSPRWSSKGHQRLGDMAGPYVRRPHDAASAWTQPPAWPLADSAPWSPPPPGSSAPTPWTPPVRTRRAGSRFTATLVARIRSRALNARPSRAARPSDPGVERARRRARCGRSPTRSLPSRISAMSCTFTSSSLPSPFTPSSNIT